MLVEISVFYFILYIYSCTERKEHTHIFFKNNEWKLDLFFYLPISYLLPELQSSSLVCLSCRLHLLQIKFQSSPAFYRVPMSDPKTWALFPDELPLLLQVPNACLHRPWPKSSSCSYISIFFVLSLASQFQVLFTWRRTLSQHLYLPSIAFNALWPKSDNYRPLQEFYYYLCSDMPKLKKIGWDFRFW